MGGRSCGRPELSIRSIAVLFVAGALLLLLVDKKNAKK
jgi:hypothetical protein